MKNKLFENLMENNLSKIWTENYLIQEGLIELREPPKSLQNKEIDLCVPCFKLFRRMNTFYFVFFLKQICKHFSAFYFSVPCASMSVNLQNAIVNQYGLIILNQKIK